MWLIYLSAVFAVLGVGVMAYSLFKKSPQGDGSLEPYVPVKDEERGPLSRVSQEKTEPLKHEALGPQPKKIEPLKSQPGESKDLSLSLQADLEAEKKKVREISQEFTRTKEQEGQLKSELDALKKEMLLKDKQLAEAQQELDKHSGGDVELGKQLKAKADEMALLEKDNHGLALKSKNLEVEVASKEKEIASLNVAVSELKAKFDEFSIRLASSEAALRKSQESEKDSSTGLEASREQLAANEEVARQSFEKEAALQKEKSGLKEQLQAKSLECENLYAVQQSKLEVINVLKGELTSKDAAQAEALAKLEKDLEAAGQRIRELQGQLSEKEAASQAVSGGVPEEEYNKLKEKLEAAEKVLRIIHGAQ